MARPQDPSAQVIETMRTEATVPPSAEDVRLAGMNKKLELIADSLTPESPAREFVTAWVAAENA